MYYYYYYIMGIILLPGIILSLYAQFKVNHTYNKYKEEFSERNLTAKQVCEQILNAGNLNVQITEVEGNLTDYYDSKKKILALSSGNINSTSISAIGVAAHEAGHALQDAENYKPMKIRNFVVVLSNISSKLLWPLIFIGLVFDFALYYSNFAQIFLYTGIIFFGLSVILNLITLPVEFNASNRAIAILENSTILNSTETAHAKKVLSAAALTYVAAFIYSLLNLLRFILVFSNKRD